MKVLFVLGLTFAVAGMGKAYAQSENSEFVKEYTAETNGKATVGKPTTIIGMNFRNSDGSSMGSYVINGEAESVQSTVASKDFPPKGIDNKKYAEAMNGDQFIEAEEINTCKMDFDDKDEKNN